jgi:hypothetical protein
MTTTTVYLAYLIDSNYPNEKPRNCFSTRELAAEYLFSCIKEEIEGIQYKDIEELKGRDWFEADEFNMIHVKDCVERTEANLNVLYNILNYELDFDCYTVVIEPMILDQIDKLDIQGREEKYQLC